MLRMNRTDLPKGRLPWLLPCLLGGLVFGSAVGAEQPQPAAAIAHAQPVATVPTAYRVINLRPGALSGIPAINASGHVAFSVEDETGASRGFFYDGTSMQDIGTLGGTWTVVTGLNDAGQVAGFSYFPNGSTYRGFVWSTRSGMRALGALNGFGTSTAVAINNLGQVAGNSTSATNIHAYRWSSAEGMADIGTFTNSGSSFTNATAINNVGLVVGWGDAADLNGHAFAWTPRAGLIDLGTLGGPTSFAAGVDANGQVVGSSMIPSRRNRAFIWTRGGGMRDLGTAGGVESFGNAISQNGQVIGGIDFADGSRRGFSWTRASGMTGIGTLGGKRGTAVNALNNKGQVIGLSDTRKDDYHAIIWTARQGVIDLNKRLRHAPPGLVLEHGLAISDNGAIVATSNAGLVLLKPDCSCKGMPAVGPIAAADMVEVGAPFDASVSFADADTDTAARHNIFWSWGDGSGDQQGNARENNGAGVASANHRYTAPGIYTVTAKVGDRAGKGVTVSRTIVAYEPSAGAAVGSGWFISPPRGDRIERSQAGRAVFSFFTPAVSSATATGAKALLQFHVGTLSFRSENIRPVAVQGARGHFEGSGKINGAGDYKFTLTTTAGTAAGEGQPGSFGLKIWHIDPATKAEVVDYDTRALVPEVRIRLLREKLFLDSSHFGRPEKHNRYAQNANLH